MQGVHEKTFSINYPRGKGKGEKRFALVTFKAWNGTMGPFSHLVRVLFFVDTLYIHFVVYQSTLAKNYYTPRLKGINILSLIRK